MRHHARQQAKKRPRTEKYGAMYIGSVGYLTAMMLSTTNSCTPLHGSAPRYSL